MDFFVFSDWHICNALKQTTNAVALAMYSWLFLFSAIGVLIVHLSKLPVHWHCQCNHFFRFKQAALWQCPQANYQCSGIGNALLAFFCFYPLALWQCPQANYQCSGIGNTLLAFPFSAIDILTVYSSKLPMQ